MEMEKPIVTITIPVDKGELCVEVQVKFKDGYFPPDISSEYPRFPPGMTTLPPSMHCLPAPPLSNPPRSKSPRTRNPPRLPPRTTNSELNKEEVPKDPEVPKNPEDPEVPKDPES